MGGNEANPRAVPVSDMRGGVAPTDPAGREPSLRARFEGMLRPVVDTPINSHVHRWKASGRPVIGYFCPYVPPELILAAGALPLRLRAPGSTDSSDADAFLSGRLCTYVRHVMNAVLGGAFEVLDGVVGTNSCDHVRRAHDLFASKTNVAFRGFVSVPRNVRESLFPYYLAELEKLRRGLSDYTGRPVTDDSLREAIVARGAVRARLLEVQRAQRDEPPRLSGAESIALHVASQVMPPADFVALADSLLAELDVERVALPPPRARLLLIGAELDDPHFVQVLESQGALVVGDLLCFGARSLPLPIDVEGPSPLEAIARATFFRPSCARMIGGFDDRFAAIQSAMSEARADGVIFQRLMFCDPSGADVHNLLHRAGSPGAPPLLVLSREYGVVATGQVRTRVQAFVEKLEIARARNRAGSAA